MWERLVAGVIAETVQSGTFRLEPPADLIFETLTDGDPYTFDLSDDVGFKRYVKWAMAELPTLQLVVTKLNQKELATVLSLVRWGIGRVALPEDFMQEPTLPEKYLGIFAETLSKRRQRVETMFVTADKIKVRTQEWLWDRRIPRRLLTLLVGMQGKGKSQFCAWLAAQVSIGALGGEPAGVMILSAEDDLEVTLAPRLQAAGADMSRAIIHRIEKHLSLPKDLQAIEEAVLLHDVSLIIIDPVMSYLDRDVDAFKPKEVRQALGPLHELCQRRDVTILGLMHFRKEKATHSLHMVTSSSAFTEAARSVLGLGDVPEGKGSGLAIVHAKSNVGPMMPTLGLTIEKASIMADDGTIIETSRVKVGGMLKDVTVDDVFQPTKTGRPAKVREDAKEFIRGMLKQQGGRVRAQEIKKAWGSEGSYDTLKRARQEMGVVAVWDLPTGEWFWQEQGSIDGTETLKDPEPEPVP
jgi:hypothetical protein